MPTELTSHPNTWGPSRSMWFINFPPSKILINLSTTTTDVMDRPNHTLQWHQLYAAFLRNSEGSARMHHKTVQVSSRYHKLSLLTVVRSLQTPTHAASLLRRTGAQNSVTFSRPATPWFPVNHQCSGFVVFAHRKWFVSHSSTRLKWPDFAGPGPASLCVT